MREGIGADAPMIFYWEYTQASLKYPYKSKKKLTFPTVSDPDKVYDKYKYSCYSVGYVTGKLNTYLPPAEDQDFAEFVSLITGTNGTELKRIFTRFAAMKERGAALYLFMKNEMNTDLIKTQNANFPEDPLPENIFD